MLLADADRPTPHTTLAISSCPSPIFPFLHSSIITAVSRNRYWGTPLPIWSNADYSELVCIGSVAELEEKAGLPKGSVSDDGTWANG